MSCRVRNDALIEGCTLFFGFDSYRHDHLKTSLSKWDTIAVTWQNRWFDPSTRYQRQLHMSRVPSIGSKFAFQANLAGSNPAPLLAHFLCPKSQRPQYAPRAQLLAVTSLFVAAYAKF